MNNLIYQAAPLISIKNPLPGGNSMTIWGVVISALDIVLPLAAVLFVFMFIYSGFTYMTSSGDIGKVKTAQAMMTNAIIGIVIIAFAFVILKLVQNGLGF